MTYSVKTYQEGFIQSQFEIGSKLYDPWPMGGQTRPQQLEQAYSAESFDPETRFYLFEGNTMVGFLTSSFQQEKDGKQHYLFEFPYVLEEHQPEGERVLLDHAIAALKDKGADVLVARAGEYWGNSLKYAKEYGFEQKSDIARRGNIVIDDVTEPLGDTSVLEDFNAEEHIDPLAQMYADRFNSTKENMTNQLSRWKNLNIGDSFTSPWDHTLTVLTHKVVVDNGEVKGRLVGMNHSNFPEDTINMSQLLLAENNKEYIGACLQQLVETGKQNNKSTIVLHTGLWGSFPDDTPFEPFGIDFSMKLAYFEKEI